MTDVGSFLPPRWRLGSQVAQGTAAPVPHATAGDAAAFGASLPDVFGVPSSVAAAAGYPGWSNLEAAHPGASLGAGLLTGSAEGAVAYKGLSALGRAIKANPKLAAMIGAGVVGGAGTALAGDQPVGRPEFTQEDQDRLKQLQGTVDKAHADKQKFINSKEYGKLPLSGKNAQNATFDQTAKDAQASIDAMHTDMQGRQAEYDKAGEPFAVRSPDAADAMRKGAIGLAAAHGFARGLMGKNPFVTAGLGTMEALGGAYAPTVIDILKPPGTPASTLAKSNVWDPNYLKTAVAPDLLFGGIASSVGHGLGHTTADLASAAGSKIAQAYKWLKGGSSAGTLAADTAPMAQQPAAAAPAFDYSKTTPKDVYTDAAGKYRWNTGHPNGRGGKFAPAPSDPTSSAP